MSTATAMCQRCCAKVIGDQREECQPTGQSLPAGHVCTLGVCSEVCYRKYRFFLNCVIVENNQPTKMKAQENAYAVHKQGFCG